jgi:hypothetical protein
MYTMVGEVNPRAFSVSTTRLAEMHQQVFHYDLPLLTMVVAKPEDMFAYVEWHPCQNALWHLAAKSFVG